MTITICLTGVCRVQIYTLQGQACQDTYIPQSYPKKRIKLNHNIMNSDIRNNACHRKYINNVSSSALISIVFLSEG